MAAAMNDRLPEWRRAPSGGHRSPNPLMTRSSHPAVRRSLAEVDAGGYLNGDCCGGHPVNDEAERWPPPGVRHELTAVLPEVLEPVAGQAEDEQPRRCRNGRRGEDDEDRGDADLDSDHDRPSVGDREADVDRGDQYETEGVDGR